MKSFLVGFLAAVALMVLYGCGDEEKFPTEGVPLLRGNSTRVEVTLISLFTDDLAYNGQRGVYIIKDTYTGVEYIGISGVGISAVGEHQKNETDER